MTKADIIGVFYDGRSDIFDYECVLLRSPNNVILPLVGRIHCMCVPQIRFSSVLRSSHGFYPQGVE